MVKKTIINTKIEVNLHSLTGGGLRTLLCQIHGEKTKGFVDDGPDVHVRCGGKDNYKYKNKSKITFLNGRWLENWHE